MQQSSNVLEQEVKKQEAEGAAVDLGGNPGAGEKVAFYGDQAKPDKDALYRRFSVKPLAGGGGKGPDSSTAAVAGVVSLDAYQQKAEEVERLQDLLEKEEQALKAERQQVSELHEAAKVAEERTTRALAE